MYELFEFVRVFTVKSIRPDNNQGKVELVKYAWKEEGEISFLAMLCSNDYLILRYDAIGHAPITKQLPWFSDEEIVSMCFDPMMTSLLIVTRNSDKLFIVPALALMNPDANMNQMFPKDDVTIRSYDSGGGSVSCAIWWQTLEGNQIAIVGTTIGELVFINLLDIDPSHTRITIDTTITALSLSHDDGQMNTKLLITTITGNQWHLLLESRTTETSFSPDSELSDMGYDHVDGRTIPPRSILDATEENSIIFRPLQFNVFQPPTLLIPQYAKGHHFITAHCMATSTLQVMDPSTEHSPFFVYKLPSDAGQTILTDVLIFTTINHSRDRKLIALSNQKAENSIENQQEFDNASVIQEFLLPEDESLLGIERKRFPFYFHEHKESENIKWINLETNMFSKGHTPELDPAVFSIPVRVHTVLDGCIIVTNNSLYQLRPRVSPERLFLHLALTLPETIAAEDLAISIGLDLTTLSELGAEYMLKQSHFSKAMKLYTLSKCPAAKRTGNLARHGCISEVTVQLRQVLSSPGYEFNPSERKFLSNMLLYCFVYQLQRGKTSPVNMLAGLKDFLLGSFSFDEKTALNLLANCKQVDLLLSLAKARGVIVEALHLLVKAEMFQSIPFSSLTDLVQKGFTVHLIQAEMLLPCLPEEDLVRLLITRPQLAIQNYFIIQPLIMSLRHNQLFEIAKIFDPSKSVMRGILIRLQTSRKRTNSLTSISSFSSNDITDTPGELKEHRMESLLEFFLLVILQLNHLRRLQTKQPSPLNFDLLVGNDIQDAEQKVKQEEANDIHVQLSIQYQPVACGPKHAAAIRNGDLYTWGRCLHGRLGHGEMSQAMCAPIRVETLHMLKLKVEAVACGNEHTLALTQQGVYGWGNSKYGQVGVGTNQLYRRPMLVESLQSENIVAIACGHYHSLCLTTDHQVYSWGWGVHGQLGHGDVEDGRIPHHIKALLSVKVIRIAAGYSHSLVLSDDGQVWSFGCGYFGQLGLGSNTKSSIPVKVCGITDPVRHIATKYFHSLAVTETNHVYIWGSHPHNLRQAASSIRQARHSGRQAPPYNPYLLPVSIDLTYVQGKIIKVCCGSLHNLLLAEDGSVYVWGRNLEGQLGTGSRQDETIPKMLTSLSSHQILVADSGGEFSMAMDTNGTAWLWGKNDFAQLGYLKSHRENRMVNKQGSGHKSNSNGQSTEFMTPTAVRGLAKFDPTDQTWMTMLDSLNDDRLWAEPEDPFHKSVISKIPDLDRYGQVSYSHMVVPITLKVCETLLTTKFCLQKCVDLRDWLTAGHVSCLDEDYVEALHYRFQTVVENMEGNKHDDVISLCICLFSHHINLVLGKTLPEAMQTKELTSLCEEALDLWQKHDFPMVELEKVFSQHLPVLSSWLIKTILNPVAQRKFEDDENGTQRSSKLLLSTKFSLQVLNYCMKNPNTVQLFNNQGKSLINEKTTIKSGGTGRADSHKLTPKDRLWSDILRNLKKDPGCINLTHSQIEHMQDQMQSTDEEQSESRFVLFTCGHHYPESVYKKEIVPSMVDHMSKGPKKLSTSALLLKQLLFRTGLKPMACPKCIKQGLLTL